MSLFVNTISLFCIKSVAVIEIGIFISFIFFTPLSSPISCIAFSKFKPEVNPPNLIPLFSFIPRSFLKNDDYCLIISFCKKYDNSMNLVKKGLKEAAMNVCMKTIKDEKDCQSIIDFVIKNKNAE